jgi:hypothetical protein
MKATKRTIVHFLIKASCSVRISTRGLFLQKLLIKIVGERSEISNFCSDMKGVLGWKDSPFINQKEREAERE